MLDRPPTNVDHRCGQVVKDCRKDQGPRETLLFTNCHRPFGLIPDFSRDPASLYTDAINQGLKSRIDLEDESTVLPSLTYGGENFEIEPWLEILTRYHDDVWGDITPYVNAAREEANSLRNVDDNQQPRNYPAIRRLAMVVSHLRDRVDN